MFCILSRWALVGALIGLTISSSKFAVLLVLFYLTTFLNSLFLLQLNFAVQMPHVIFTGLEDYKARGTQASPYFTVTHYTEFAETKDTVLIRGDVVFTSKLTDEEADRLLDCSIVLPERCEVQTCGALQQRDTRV
jgi:hypothetical protein